MKKSLPKIPSVGIGKLSSTMWKLCFDLLSYKLKFNSEIPIDFIFSFVIPENEHDCTLSTKRSSFNLPNLHNEISAPVSIKNVKLVFVPMSNCI